MGLSNAKVDLGRLGWFEFALGLGGMDKNKYDNSFGPNTSISVVQYINVLFNTSKMFKKKNSEN